MRVSPRNSAKVLAAVLAIAALGLALDGCAPQAASRRTSPRRASSCIRSSGPTRTFGRPRPGLRDRRRPPRCGSTSACRPSRRGRWSRLGPRSSPSMAAAGRTATSPRPTGGMSASGWHRAATSRHPSTTGWPPSTPIPTRSTTSNTRSNGCGSPPRSSASRSTPPSSAPSAAPRAGISPHCSARRATVRTARDTGSPPSPN